MDKLLQVIALIAIFTVLGSLIWFVGTNCSDVEALSNLARDNEVEKFLASGAAIGVVLAIIVVLRR